MNNVTRLFDLLPYYAATFKPKDDVLAAKDNGIWVKYTIQDYIKAADNISYGLMELGIGKGDNIATIAASRPEWNFIDMGIMQTGAVHVPLYPTISEDDYRFILNHAGIKYILIPGKEAYRKLQPIIAEIPSLKGVYTIKEANGLPLLEELINLGEQNQAAQKLDEVKRSIQPTDLATIIYTSGTTGNPKGVMLNHNNIISNFKACAHILPFGEEGRALSYLPLCHIYERMLNYLCQYAGVSVYYAESIATIGDNVKEVKPNLISTVPRLLEKIYDKIINTGRKLKGIKKFIFFRAVHIGLNYELNRANGWWYTIQLNLARKLVFSKWNESLGGNLKVIVSGGAALQPRLARTFWAAGIPVLEGYGLTETSPVIAVNNFDKNGVAFGTVGPIIEGTTVKIANDHEILCKGPGVMIGYYKDADLTAGVIDKDGWFHTGDQGRIEPQGHLKITGRKKEIFKTSFGKYISPELIENKFKESHFIDSLMVVGENQKYAAAIIVPDFTFLKSYCNAKEIPYSSDSEVIANPRIVKRYHKEIQKLNKSLGATEQIKSFELLDKEWSVESGEVTATLKLRRKFIHEKYSTQISKLFNKESGE
ncbi:MAG TPA: long-chain fatty acid--CoA ligase [Bacteroidales bacterium]|nr:long-chain fatty acid--CoA ligase [Bacteroidales bacterium]